MRYTFQGLEFTDEKQAEGRAWFSVDPGGLRGLRGGPSVRRENTERPSQHGSFAAPGYFGDRLIEVQGHILAGSTRELEWAERKLAGLTSAYSEFVAYESNTLRTLAAVQSLDVDRIATTGEERTSAFLLQLWCPDPWLYGDARRVELTSANPSQLVVNRGTANAWPVLRFEGPVTAPFGFTIAGRRVNVSKSLTAGQWVEVDTRTGAATTNSVEGGRLFSEVTGLMPFIPPGSRTFTWQLTGKCVVTWSDTYK